MAGRNKSSEFGVGDRWLIGLVGYYVLLAIASLENVPLTRLEMGGAYLLPSLALLAAGTWHVLARTRHHA